jgi:sialate O-acetylesterase
MGNQRRLGVREIKVVRLKHHKRWIGGFASTWLFISVTCCFAASPTTLPSVFGDHMVLQRDIPIPVWGKAEPGTVVCVTVGGNMAKVTADAGGAWLLKLPPLKMSATPIDFSVADGSGPVVTFHDVLVGDVWLASGQSNMQLPLRQSNNGDAEIANANEPAVRLFQVAAKSSRRARASEGNHWQLCSPESAAGFSAVAYYFARAVHQSEQVPIGMIGSYVPGTRIEAWSSVDEMLNVPRMAEFGKEIEDRKANMPALQKQYTDEIIPAWQKEHDAWEAEFGNPYHEALKKWNADAAAAKASGAEVPAKPVPGRPEPKKPDPPTVNPHKFGNLFSTMIAPLIPYALKGVIWYQGESNADEPARYAVYFPGLIEDWRRQWTQPGDRGSLTHDFPFIYVQLPNFVSYPNADWPGLREVQAKTLALEPNTAMVVTIDVGTDSNIHPKNKLDVGNRLALAAEHLAYGQTNVVSEAPMFASIKIDGNVARIRFKDIGGGLVVGRPPATTKDAPAAFMIAGQDGNFFAADAKIVGTDSVEVSSARVPHPADVRYAWSNTPHVNLYSSDGLPAAPFRTDNFKTVIPATIPATEPAR